MNHKDIHRRFLRNAGMFMGSRVVFGLLNLGTNAIILRSFGAADLGMLLLLVAYLRVFAEVLKFDSWQAVLRFGVIAAENTDNARLRRLLGLTIGVDLTAMLTGILVSILLLPQAAVWFGWGEQISRLAPWFMILIVFVTHATPNGVMRLFDRVEVLALQHGLNATIRLALVLLAIVLGGGVHHLAMAWAGGFIISASMTMIVCARELMKRDLIPKVSLRFRRTAAQFPGIWHFLLMSNLLTIAPLAINHLTTLLVGAQLGATQAAALQLARQFSTGLSSPARMLGALLLPDFSRLSGHGNWAGLRDVLKQQFKVTTISVLGLGVVLFAVLPLVIEALFGAEMLVHVWLFRLMLIAALINILTFSLYHALFSANKGGTALLIEIFGMAVYAVILLAGLPGMGLIAAGVATIAFSATSRGLALFIGGRLLKKRIRRARRAAADAGAHPPA